MRSISNRHHAAVGQSLGPVSVGHALVQSDARHVAGRRGRTRSTQAADEHGPARDDSRQFSGTAQAFQDSLANQPLLILAALVTVYIVLGILYESYIHPITILSTLPSAGVGALLALLLCKTELSVMALIGIMLLIGIVKKNAIMMIDFALEAERNARPVARGGDYEACVLRFRPITMTTMAALLGGLPLALRHRPGSELRRPLGIAIVGGLIFSQMLTLYTTPVVYLYLDRFRLWLESFRPARELAPSRGITRRPKGRLRSRSLTCAVGTTLG